MASFAAVVKLDPFKGPGSSAFVVAITYAASVKNKTNIFIR
jgi:hypothetical protein